MTCKIVEVPVADKTQAEKIVNEAITALGSGITISNIINLDDRRIAIFYAPTVVTP